MPLDKEPPTAKLSPTASAMVRKLAELKKALEFDPASKSRLDEARSHEDLLRLVQDMFLSRFVSLHKIGLIPSESFRLLESFRERIDTLLADGAKGGTDRERLDAKELAGQVQALSKKLRDLDAKHALEGVITEREHVLGEENQRLHQRLRGQRTQLKLAGIQLKTLSSMREMVRSLQARNSMLRSKVERQAMLLRSLVQDGSNRGELESTAEKMTHENRDLKTQLEGIAALMSRCQSSLPEEARAPVLELIKRNAGLMAMFEGRGAQLDEVLIKAGEGPEQPFLERIEKLSDENTQLKQMLRTKHMIHKFIEGEKDGSGENPDRIVEALKVQNQQLEQALRAREEQIKLLKTDPSNRPLLKALYQLREKHVQVLRDNAHKEQECRQLAVEKREYEKRFRDTHLLMQTNRRLEMEIETSRQRIEALRKRDLEYVALRKEHVDVRSRYQVLAAQYAKAGDKLMKLTEEYNLLMREYENLFKR